MKNRFRFLSILFFLAWPFWSAAQDAFDITGAWTGQIYNDSTRQYIPFELAISRNNGELTGYSYIVFLIDSIENIGVKQVEITRNGNTFEIRDKRLIDDNYAERPAKGVYTTFELEPSENDTVDILSGRWFTNKTKKYYPLSGTAFLTRKKRYNETRIVPKLYDLGLGRSLSFVQEGNMDYAVASISGMNQGKDSGNEKMITIVEPELVITMPAKDTAEKIKIPESDKITDILASVESAREDVRSLEKPEKGKNEKQEVVAVNITSGNKNAVEETIRSNEKEVKEVSADDPPVESVTGEEATKTIATTREPQNNNTVEITGVPETPEKAEQLTNPSKEKEAGNQEIAVINDAINSGGNQVKPENKQEQLIDSIAGHIEATGEIVTSIANQPIGEQEEKNAIASVNRLLEPPADLVKREIETIRSVNIYSDSIILSLYDNGAIDGDTVSVIVNDKVVMPKVGLLATAHNQTIYLTPEMGDSIKIVLYAENLGSIPPNTGLLIVRDGGRNHEIRFSGDLRTNSAIILLRNKEQ